MQMVRALFVNGVVHYQGKIEAKQHYVLPFLLDVSRKNECQRNPLLTSMSSVFITKSIPLSMVLDTTKLVVATTRK